METIVVTEEQRRGTLRQALSGGGKARVFLTSGQRRALEEQTVSEIEAPEVESWEYTGDVWQVSVRVLPENGPVVVRVNGQEVWRQ